MGGSTLIWRTVGHGFAKLIDPQKSPALDFWLFSATFRPSGKWESESFDVLQANFIY